MTNPYSNQFLVCNSFKHGTERRSKSLNKDLDVQGEASDDDAKENLSPRFIKNINDNKIVVIKRNPLMPSYKINEKYHEKLFKRYEKYQNAFKSRDYLSKSTTDYSMLVNNPWIQSDQFILKNACIRWKGISNVGIANHANMLELEPQADNSLNRSYASIRSTDRFFKKSEDDQEEQQASNPYDSKRRIHNYQKTQSSWIEKLKLLKKKNQALKISK